MNPMIISFLIFFSLDSVQISSSEEYLWLDQVLRRETIAQNCNKFGQKGSRRPKLKLEDLDHILVDHNYRFLYCYVPKVACTNWKRVLMVLSERANSTDLSTIPADFVHDERNLQRLSDLPEDRAFELLGNYTSFLMVRHPFERLLSAYRNKLVGNTTSSRYFQTRVGRHIIKSFRRNPSARSLARGDDVTFREFASYLIRENHNLTNSLNEHFRPIADLCRPCSVEYTFVGKHERLDDDSAAILRLIGAPPQVRLPRQASARTRDVLRAYLGTLSVEEVRELYEAYSMDFRLFGYGLGEVLGYEIAE